MGDFDLGAILGSWVATYAIHYDSLVERLRDTTPCQGKMIVTP